jgi:hypothetical protein
VAEHRHRAPVPLAKPLEDLHGGGLARAVRAEQGENLTAGDVQIDAIDRGDVRVALAQVPDHHGRIGVHAFSLGSADGAARQPTRHTCCPPFGGHTF